MKKKTSKAFSSNDYRTVSTGMNLNIFIKQLLIRRKKGAESEGEQNETDKTIKDGVGNDMKCSSGGGGGWDEWSNWIAEAKDNQRV